MRVPRECYRLAAAIAAPLPALRPAQRLGLAVWVYGAGVAGSACQAAAVAALLPLGGSLHAWRQYLREWLYAGAARAAPCRAELEVARCFAPRLRWVVAWWRGTDLALAVDATTLADRVVVLTVSAVYRGGAIPVAWHVRPATAPGEWMPLIVGRRERLAPAVPAGWTVLVLADRGPWSPRLWAAPRALGWHPLLRLQRTSTFRPAGQERRGRGERLVPGPGHAWAGAGVACRDKPDRLAGTLLVGWDEGAAEPWVLLTDLDPAQAGVCWYGLRAWIELGFRALKGLGWPWERTRRTEADRVARHWLVLAVATRWVVAYGTRAEDAARVGAAPANRRTAPPPPPAAERRMLSAFARGLGQLRHQLHRVRRLWRRVWLVPEPWPEPPPRLVIHRVLIPTQATHDQYLPL